MATASDCRAITPQQTSAGRGLVILLHGWEGCADSDYMLSVSSRLYQAGFSVFRLNLRDHGNTQALNPELFHSCRIDEVVNAVKCVMQSHPALRVALVGQSLGGNFAVRVAARAPKAGIDLHRVVAVCPVLKPHSTMQALEEGFWVYRQYFLRRWRRSLLAKAVAFPGRYEFGDLRKFQTLTATTDFFVRNYTDFATLDDYLNGYTLTGSTLQGLSVPTRLILAADDPVVPSDDLKNIQRSDALTVDLFAHGGHCGFIETYGIRRWIDTQIVDDLRQHL